MIIAALFLLSMISIDLSASDKSDSSDKKINKKCCSEKVLTCPVTGEKIKDKSKAVKYEYKGKTLYFCCEKCVEKFKADPQKYFKQCSEDCKKKGCDTRTGKKDTKKKK